MKEELKDKIEEIYDDIYANGSADATASEWGESVTVNERLVEKSKSVESLLALLEKERIILLDKVKGLATDATPIVADITASGSQREIIDWNLIIPSKALDSLLPTDRKGDQ